MNTKIVYPKFSLKNHYLELVKEEPQVYPINPMDPSPLPIEVQDISLDARVDSYFMKYEKESLPTQKSYQVPGTDLGFPTQMMETVFRSNCQFLLKEAEEDVDPALAGTDTPEMGSPDTSSGSDTETSSTVPQPPQISNPRININNFAQSIARLVLNYDNLLDPKTTILNRAKSFIQRNYDGGVAEQMMQILSQQFGLEPRSDLENTAVQAPFAAGAWDGLGGGTSTG